MLLLADTSLSMGVADGEDGTAAAPTKNALSRSQQIAAALKESDFIARLRKTHDLSVFEFSEDLKRDRVVTLRKQKPEESVSEDPAGSATDAATSSRPRVPTPRPIGPSCSRPPAPKRGLASRCGSWFRRNAARRFRGSSSSATAGRTPAFRRRPPSSWPRKQKSPSSPSDSGPTASRRTLA